MNWNIERVKLHLPTVRVSIGGKVFIGQVEGRCLPRPVIWVYKYLNPGLAKYFRWESTWKEVVTSLNNNEPLRGEQPREVEHGAVPKPKRPTKKTRAGS